MKRLALLAWVLLFAHGLPAQVADVHDGELALEFPSPRRPEASWFVDYTTYNQEPAFRIAVHHYHAACEGYLYATPTRVAYVPAFSPEQKDAFDVLPHDITTLQPRFSGVQLQANGHLQKFAFLTDHRVTSAAPQENAHQAVVDFFTVAIRDFSAAQARLAAALVASSGSTAAGADSVAPAAPVVKVLSPPGVSEGQLLDAGATAVRLLGYAAAPSEIRTVLINNAPATLRALSPKVAEFLGGPIQFTDAVTPVQVKMVSAGGESELNFKLRKPVVQWPHIPLETRHSVYTLEGRLTGYGKVQAVDVGGRAARLQNNPDGSSEFVVPDLPVNPGDNLLTGVITTAQGTRETFPVKIYRYRRLSLSDIKAGLQKLSTRRLLDLIAERGVDFPLNPATERELRAAGAGSEVLRAIADADRD